jgi:hypothetical protein
MTDTDLMLIRWQIRPCFICGTRGLCEHREVAVAQAEIEADDRRTEARNQAKPRPKVVTMVKRA